MESIASHGAKLPEWIRLTDLTLTLRQLVDDSEFSQQIQFNDIRKEYTRITDNIRNSLEEFPIRIGQGESFSLLSRAYVSRLLFSVFIFFLGCWINSLCSTAAGWKTPRVLMLDLDGNIAEFQTLPDIMHSATFWLTKQQLEFLIQLPDYFVVVTTLAAFILVLFHPLKLLIIRRCALLVGIINTLRGVAVISTFLPDPSPRCRLEFEDPVLGAYKRLPIWPEVWHRTVQRILITPGDPPDCGDVMFSGHVAFLVANFCLFLYYCRPGSATLARGQKSFQVVQFWAFVARWIMGIVCALGIIITACSRFHYSIDVASGMFITFETFHVYHLAAQISSEKKKQSGRFLQWLEEEEVLMAERKAYLNLVELLRRESQKKQE